MVTIMGIDPGYATQGLACLQLKQPGMFEIVYCEAMRGEQGAESRDKVQGMAAQLRQTLAKVVAAHGAPQLIGVEQWRGGKDATTAYYRGRYDAEMLHSFTPQAFNGGRPYVYEIKSSQVKAFLNALGKATDKGRKTDDEFMQAVLLLDTCVSNPDACRTPVLPKGSSRWKEARVHVIEAVAIALLAYFRSRHGQENLSSFRLSPAQLTVLRKPL